MKFDPVLLAPRMAPMKAAGLWRDETIDVHVQRALKNCPDKPAVVAYAAEARAGAAELPGTRRQGRPHRARPRQPGVGRQDVVTFQLPTAGSSRPVLACARIGAVANPVMPIFRQHELTFMLNFGESKVFIVPKVFRGFDYEAMARGCGAICRSSPT
jgi:cyclohexanecarboxylate-CoA ligase